MRNKRTVGIIAVAGLFLLLGVVYFFVDPMEVRWMPKCIWKMATGTDCPGCGSQRMAHALAHGDIVAAWHANAYALCMLPLIGLLFWLELSRNRHPLLYRRVCSPPVVWGLGVSVFVWWILRNLI